MNYIWVKIVSQVLFFYWKNIFLDTQENLKENGYVKISLASQNIIEWNITYKNPKSFWNRKISMGIIDM